MSAGVFGVPAGCLVLVLVSLLTPKPASAEVAMVDALRRPRAEPAGPDSRAEDSRL